MSKKRPSQSRKHIIQITGEFLYFENINTARKKYSFYGAHLVARLFWSICSFSCLHRKSAQIRHAKPTKVGDFTTSGTWAAAKMFFPASLLTPFLWRLLLISNCWSANLEGDLIGRLGFPTLVSCGPLMLLKPPKGHSKGGAVA